MYATPWIGLHLFAPKARDIDAFQRYIAEGLAPLGINALIIEFSAGAYRFQSDPKLPDSGLTREQARAIADACRQNGIRPIPMFNCLGHQSWDKRNGPFITAHPEFDETPDKYPDNDGIYCRSWCPLHPDVNQVVFGLMDELIEAFDADAFHVGLDEVFIIADEDCPRCAGKDPAELFAKAVRDYHDHLVGKRGVEMMLWGDRLIDCREIPYGTWEAADNGTAPAVDLIPKDIVICDWHYEPRDSYPSVPYFQEKGFRTWPAGWYKPDATRALMAQAQTNPTERMVGHLFTTWMGNFKQLHAALLDEDTRKKADEKMRLLAETLLTCTPIARGEAKP